MQNSWTSVWCMLDYILAHVIVSAIIGYFYV